MPSVNMASSLSEALSEEGRRARPDGTCCTSFRRGAFSPRNFFNCRRRGYGDTRRSVASFSRRKKGGGQLRGCLSLRTWPVSGFSVHLSFFLYQLCWHRSVFFGQMSLILQVIGVNQLEELEHPS